MHPIFELLLLNMGIHLAAECGDFFIKYLVSAAPCDVGMGRFIDAEAHLDGLKCNCFGVRRDSSQTLIDNFIEVQLVELFDLLQDLLHIEVREVATATLI